MWLKSITISNYKSFREPTKLEFQKGMNIILGRNNSGKTAILEAINDPLLSNFRHVFPNASGVFTGSEQAVEMEIVISGHELLSAMRVPNGNYLLPSLSTGDLHDDLRVLFYVSEIVVPVIFRSGRGAFQPGRAVECDGYICERTMQVQVDTNNRFVGHTIVQSLPHSILDIAVDYFKRGRYVFKAERLNISHCPVITQGPLRPDGSNLPTEIFDLSANPRMRDRYVELVREVIPDIFEVGAIRVDGSTAEIRIWPDDPTDRPDHYSLPLNSCGTGISQVLAILLIAIKQKGGVVAIDEPNSFLHPDAVRVLLNILETRTDNQYIIATHTTEFASLLNKVTVHVVRKDGLTSVVSTLDVNRVNDAREIMEDLGTRISDVFGYHKVIWVEGPTEQKCFSLIASKFAFRGIGAVSIIPVRSTSDFIKSKDAGKIIDVYNQLTSRGDVIAPEIRFSFDRDTAKNETELANMERESNGKVRFITRRCLENYILDAEAITATLTSRVDSDITIRAEDVGRILTEEIEEKNLNVSNVDAPKVLARIYGELTEHRYAFNKITDSVAIVSWILDNKPDSIDELTAYVRRLIED